MRITLVVLSSLALSSHAFVPATRRAFVLEKKTIQHAGGFEWEDPVAAFDQNVDNPFKNSELLNGGDGMKIDPARLLSPRLSGSNLYFIGMMGSGKSSVGDVVARRMGSYNFLDTDEIIERATGMSINEIFESEGEEGFRQVEGQILDSVHAYVRCVVSTGGGIVTRMENWSKLHTGIIVWLDCEPDVIVKRLLVDDGLQRRPLLQSGDPEEKLRDILAQRISKYEQADIRIKVTEEMDSNAVADAVIRELHDFIDDNPPAWKMAKAKAKAEGIDWIQ